MLEDENKKKDSLAKRDFDNYIIRLKIRLKNSYLVAVKEYFLG